MRTPIFHLPDEERRPFLRGAFLGCALSLALFTAGIGVWSATHKQETKEPYVAQSPFDSSELPSQSLSILGGRPVQAQATSVQTGQVQTAQPIQATKAAAGVQAAASPQSPIPLPNVPNVPVIVQATQPQQPVQPVVQAQPAAQPAPAAPAKPSPPQQENAVVRSGETFGDGRIAYFGGMEVPHEKTGENHGT